MKTRVQVYLAAAVAALLIIMASAPHPAAALKPGPVVAGRHGSVTVYAFDLAGAGLLVASTVEGPAAVVGGYLYTPAGVASLPCGGRPLWVVSSADGSESYILVEDDGVYSLCMAYWRQGGGPSFSLHRIPGRLDAGHALVYAGVLYAWLREGDSTLYIVADASKGTVSTWRLEGAWVAGPEGSPVRAPRELQGPAPGLEVEFRDPWGRSAVYRSEGGLAVRWLNSWLSIPAFAAAAATGDWFAAYASPAGGSVNLSVATSSGETVSVGLYGYRKVLALNDRAALLLAGNGELALARYEVERQAGGPVVLRVNLTVILGEFNPLTDQACLLGDYAAFTHDGHLYIYRFSGGEPGSFRLWIGSRPLAYCSRDGSSMVVVSVYAGRVFIVSNSAMGGPGLLSPLALGSGGVYYSSGSGLVVVELADLAQASKTAGGSPPLAGFTAPGIIAALEARPSGAEAAGYTVAPVDFDSIGIHPDPGLDSVYLITPQGAVMGPLARVGQGVYRLNGLAWGLGEYVYVAAAASVPPFQFRILGRASVAPPPSVFRVVVVIDSGHAKLAGVEPGRLEAVLVVRSAPLPFPHTIYYTCGGPELTPLRVPANASVYASPFNPGLSGCPSLRVLVPGYWEGGVPRIVARAVLSLEGGALASLGSPVSADFYAQASPSGALAAGSGVVEPVLDAPVASVLVARNAVVHVASGTLEFNVTVPVLRVTITGSGPPRASVEGEAPPQPAYGVPGWLYTLLATAGGVGLACAGSLLYYSRRH